MISTQNEAARLWCPMKKTGDRETQRCISANCAMWRWVEPTQMVAKREVFSTGTATFGERTVHVRAQPTQGFCGLAGVPTVAP